MFRYISTKHSITNYYTLYILRYRHCLGKLQLSLIRGRGLRDHDGCATNSSITGTTHQVSSKRTQDDSSDTSSVDEDFDEAGGDGEDYGAELRGRSIHTNKCGKSVSSSSSSSSSINSGFTSSNIENVAILGNKGNKKKNQTISNSIMIGTHNYYIFHCSYNLCNISITILVC